MPTRTPVDRARVLQLVRQGVSVRAIADRMAVSRGVVYAVLRLHKEVAK